MIYLEVKKIILYSILIGFLLLFVKILPNYQIFIAVSGSMEPTIKTGSLVISKKASNYVANDIVTFIYKENLITHRISRFNDGVFYTKGDANKQEDFFRIHKGDIIGKQLFTVPYLGYVVAFLQSKTGFIFYISLLFIFLYINKIYLHFTKFLSIR